MSVCVANTHKEDTMHKIDQTPLIRFYSARSCVLTRDSRSVTCGRGWMAKIDSKQGRVITRPPPMISRGEIKLLCRDNNKWCAHNHRASASCRSHRHFDTRSDRRDALFYFRTRGRTRCGSLLDPTSRRDCSVNAFLQPDTGQKTTRQFVESRGRKKKRIFFNYFRTRIIPRSVFTKRVIHSKSV